MSILTKAGSSPNTEGTSGRELDVPARARIACTHYGHWDIHHDMYMYEYMYATVFHMHNSRVPTASR